MFQAQNRETLNSTLKVAVSFKIIIDDEHDKIVFQKTAKELQDQGQFFFTSDQSCPKTDGLRRRHCHWVDSVKGRSGQ